MRYLNTKNRIRLCVLSTFFLLLTVLVMLPSGAVSATDPLSTGYWLTPVPADQSTGRVTQTQISGGVSGHIPGDCYGAYPTWQAPGPYFDLATTPILSMDIYADTCYQLHIIIVDQSNGGWNPYGWDVTDQYGHAVKIADGTTMHVANSDASTHFEIDLRTAGIPLDDIGRISINVVAGMNGTPSNYRITNLQVRAAGGEATPMHTTQPTVAPTASPTPTPTDAPTHHHHWSSHYWSRSHYWWR